MKTAIPILFDNITYECISKFQSFICKTKDCWLWTSCSTYKGYGRFVYNGHHYLAHRLSYVIHNKCDLFNLVLHRCDNPCCVKPTHLFSGTQVENMLDMFSKGRRGTTSYGKIISEIS